MLQWHTVSLRLRDTLLKTMEAEEFNDFRLVGGTALSLQLGHRMSDDIDLFTDIAYGTVDFKAIDAFFLNNYPYVEGISNIAPGMGKMYRVGENKYQSIKVDVFYSMVPFFQPIKVEDDIRLTTVGEIIAMKLEIVKEGGRKKDFWDLHELLASYTIADMIGLHAARFTWTHEPDQIRANFTDFSRANEEEDPKCLRGKTWEFIKQDFVEALEKDRPGPDYTR